MHLSRRLSITVTIVIVTDECIEFAIFAHIRFLTSAVLSSERVQYS